ncbi:MAG: peptidylprolyl isomerase [Saprospiraceae bacterium]
MRTTRFIACLLLLCCAVAAVPAQNDTRTLFTVDGKPVTAGEFMYIYSKTNGEEASFARADMQEYLDLYQRFKLKVARAHEMGLDTVKVLQTELAGYRRQLADSYLVDRAITDRLVEEAYAHVKQDVDISHILFQLPVGAADQDTLAVYQRALDVKKRLKKEKFETLAAEFSADTYSKDKGGRVGYITALFPKGLYALEQAAYTAPLNEVVGPVRTAAGYHLLRVNGRRPARGEMEIAHILVRTPEGGDARAAKQRIDSIYTALQAGVDFESLAGSKSDDRRTALNGGYIGFFGINRYEPVFEEAAFGLKENGDYSKPIESKLGWHIVRRISQRGIKPLAEERARIETAVKADPRFEEARKSMLTRIAERADLQENGRLRGRYVAELVDTSFLSFRWKAPDPQSAEELFRLGDDYVVTMGDFQQYLQKSNRERVQRSAGGSASVVANDLYDRFLEDHLLRYEETQLEKNYPAFAALMREYEEGILLFEATKIEVWDKASEDTLGLVDYFNDHRDKYRWAERGEVTLYTVPMRAQHLVRDVLVFAEKNPPSAVLAKYGEGEDAVSAQTDTYEKGRLQALEGRDWKAGTITDMDRSKDGKYFTFYKIESIMPAARKELDEARGYVIADYQDELERKWVADLAERFPVVVNRDVFNSLIKK